MPLRLERGPVPCLEYIFIGPEGGVDGKAWWDDAVLSPGRDEGIADEEGSPFGFFQ